jgi:CelD/BcsL family acetyltransferase involved in cellulose biosynthesis
MRTYAIVSNREQLLALQPAWDALWRDSSNDLFQSHAWILGWWDDCGPEISLRIGCTWQDSRLIGVLPFCIRRWHGLRVLEWAAQPFSDYCDALLQVKAAPGLLSPLWESITKAGGFDFIRLKHVRTQAIIQSIFHHYNLTEERAEFSLQVAGPWADGNAWFRLLNKKTRNNHTRGKRILSESGTITIRQLTADEPRKPVIQRLLTLKRQWAANRNSPMVRNDTTLLALAMALDRIDCLRVFVIECDGEIIAGSVNALHQDTMIALFATYDQKYDRAGPGIILMTEYTMWAFDNGIKIVDYLLGAESYKFKFATDKTDLHIYVKSRTWRGRLALAVYDWKRRHSAPEPEIAIGTAYLSSNGAPRSRTTARDVVLEPKQREEAD